MIAMAILASVVVGGAAQYYFGDAGSFITICVVWIGVFLWKK